MGLNENEFMRFLIEEVKWKYSQWIDLFELS